MNSGGTAVVTASFVVVLAALSAGFLLLQTFAPPTSASPPIVPEVRQFSVHMHTSKVGEATMHHWMPPTLVTNVGDTVILKVTNGDPDNTHGFSLAALNIEADAIASGQTATFRFRVTRPGIYQYQCRLAGCARDHADQIGQLVVLAR